jgi:hypothetical protein
MRGHGSEALEQHRLARESPARTLLRFAAGKDPAMIVKLAMSNTARCSAIIA